LPVRPNAHDEQRACKRLHAQLKTISWNLRPVNHCSYGQGCQNYAAPEQDMTRTGKWLDCVIVYIRTLIVDNSRAWHATELWGGLWTDVTFLRPQEL
jgi:hypothetical protein